MPPETIDMSKWYPRGDVFSLGVVIYQIMADDIPAEKPQGAHVTGLFIKGCATVQDMFQATKTRQPEIHRMNPQIPRLQNLTQQLLIKQRNSRPAAPVALSDSWFATQAQPPYSGFIANTVPRGLHPLASIGMVDAQPAIR